MARTTNVAQTISVTAPDGSGISFTNPAWVSRNAAGALPQGPVSLSGTNAADVGLHRSLAREGFEILGEAQLHYPVGLARGTPIALEAKVDPDESAVVLLEQEGVFHWVTQGARSAGAPDLVRGGDPRTEVIRFALTGEPDQSPVRRGLIDDLITPVRALVLRFVAQAAVGEAVTLLERSVDSGLFPISDLTVANWSPSKASWSPTRPARKVLLLVHGTFSSIVGTFGCMADLAWGQAFLNACLAHYDLVLGFNHKTLSQDPAVNAKALLEALLEWDFGAEPPEIDIITHSRGGLVVRTLLEVLAPGSALKAHFGKAILVATTNNGTRLAEEANWSRLADLYTTLAVAAGRALSLVPQAKLAATILQEAVTSVGALVKEIATTGLDEKRVPGLAAMRPDQAFVNDLNRTQSGQLGPADSIYRVIDSSYAPSPAGDLSDLPARFVDLVKEKVVAQLMGTDENDLVVDTRSMTAIDTSAGDFVRDRVEFPHNPDIYHTNYFTRPEVVTALTRWLDLHDAAAASPETAGLSLPPLARGRNVPAAIDTDILVVDGAQPATMAADAIQEAAPTFVVIRRDLSRGEVGHYAFTNAEVAGLLRAAGGDVQTALQLHEYDATETTELDDAPSRRSRAPEGPGPRGPRRRVALQAGRAVGVYPNRVELTAGAGLAALTDRITTHTDRATIRWAMPSFSNGVTIPVVAPVPQQRQQQEQQQQQPPKRRGPTRGSALSRGDGSSSPLTPLAARAGVDYSVRAEAPSQVQQGRVFSVAVTISREALSLSAPGLASEGRSVTLQVDQPLAIEVIGKVGFISAESDEPERLAAPPEDQPVIRYFEMRGVTLGKGEIWVVARQGRLPLLTLKLSIVVEVTVAGDQGRSAPATAIGAAASIRPAGPQDCLRIAEQLVDGKVRFRYELDSRSCGLLKLYVSEPLQYDRSAFVEDLYREIESRWTGTSTQADQFAEELKEIGADLWSRLMPEGLRSDLWRNRDRLSNIFVLSEEPFIPWELLYMVDPQTRTIGAGGRFLGDLGLTRWLYEAQASPPFAMAVRPGHFKCVCPVYPEGQTTFPALQGALDEVAAIKAEFGAMDADASPTALRNLLKGDGFDLLHFAGHGEAPADAQGDPKIVVEGERSENSYVFNYIGARSVRVSASFGDVRPGVFLNACRVGRPAVVLTGLGGFAEAFLAKGAGVFVGPLWSVGDRTAGAYAQAFYKALHDGKSLAVASQSARAAARQNGDPTWLAYVVYGHPDATMSFE
jgi:hypothetical protein